MRVCRTRRNSWFCLTAAFAFACALLALACTSAAEDWPTYRHDNARSATTSEVLAPPLSPQWVYVPLHRPEPAWPEEGKEKTRVRFDEAYHVAVAGNSVYYGSSADNKVYCLDAASGQVRWSFFTAGPVRVAPSVAGGRVYFGSDDGYAYCLKAADGSLVWKVNPSFREEKVIGNGKMISLWPVRTGVVVYKGANDPSPVAYFGAGVFPNESLFLCAVKADDGTILWCNDSYGEDGYKLEYGGVSPQGPMLASEKMLFVPSGRAMPAVFTRDQGRFQYYASPREHVGGSWALLTEDRLVAGVYGKQAYVQESGGQVPDPVYAWFPGLDLVVSKDCSYMLTYDELSALDRKTFATASELRAGIDREIKTVNDELKRLRALAPKASENDYEDPAGDTLTLRKKLADLNAKRKEVENTVYKWRRPCSLRDALIMSGEYLYVGGQNAVMAVRAENGQDVWQVPVEGKACSLAIANGRLYVSTDTGRIYCFAKAEGKLREIKQEQTQNPFADDGRAALCAKAAAQILALAPVKKGYCLVVGNETGRLAYELAKRTELSIVAVDDNPQRVESARRALDAAGLYGVRVVVDCFDPAKLPYNDYFANLIVSESQLPAGAPIPTQELLRVLKPHGGILCLGSSSEAPNQGQPPSVETLREQCASQGDFSVESVADNGRWVKITRGALKGAGKWTHEYADLGNTACSDDERVKGPLGVLWFGQPGPAPMIERHSRPAAPVALDGRMFIQGENVIMAYDAYNGASLWEKKIPGAVRVRVDSDMGNLALEKDGLYVAAHDKCFRLDPATGDTVHTYELPPHADKTARWGYVACDGHTLFGSVATAMKDDYSALWEEIAGEDGEWRNIDAATARRDSAPLLKRAVQAMAAQNPKADERAFWQAETGGFMWRTMADWPKWGSVDSPVGAVTERILASTVFFAMDTETGALRWKYEGKAIAHPAIAIGDGLVFVADCDVTEDQKQAAMQQRADLIAKGVWEKDSITYDPTDADVRRVIALDETTGEKRWDRIVDLTGCGGDRMGLAYKSGILCFFGCFSNHDRGLFREGKLAWRRITAVSGKDGADLWSRPLNYLRRPVIVGDTILIEPRACDLRTGAVKTRSHPLTGEESTWEYVRPGHCCSATSAAPNMFFLRGYFLWYYDLLKDQGMLPFGGIRPGCWINVIPANGLVLFPEASAGCTCSYPIRSTVVLRPEPEQRTWSTCIQNGKLTPVRHMAINFGAQGDWRDDDGTLWFSYPHPPGNDFFKYGVNFALQEQFIDKPAYFCRNFQASGIKGTDESWIFASGCKGLTSCQVPLLGEGDAPASYTVRLYFADTENTQPGRRIFTVKLQGRPVLTDYDIVRAAGGPNVARVEEFKGVKVEQNLSIEIMPKKKAPASQETPLINGIEVIREDVALASASK
jgi:outer membrane protein assembly factor BamB